MARDQPQTTWQYR